MTTNGFDLYTIAPRLAKARDQFLALQRQENEHRIWLINERHRLQKLIAHRELQVLRAGATGDRRYIKRRQDKLDHARAELQRLEQRERARDPERLAA